MSSLYEDTTYFLRILIHPYLPCWGRSLDLQKIKTSCFVSPAFRVTINLSKRTTMTSIANYKEFKERRTTLSPLPALPSLHSPMCEQGHWRARVESHVDTKDYQITMEHRDNIRPTTQRTAGPVGRRGRRGEPLSPHRNTISWDEQREVRAILRASPHAKVSSTVLPFLLLLLSRDLRTLPRGIPALLQHSAGGENPTCLQPWLAQCWNSRSPLWPRGARRERR